MAKLMERSINVVRKKSGSTLDHKNEVLDDESVFNSPPKSMINSRFEGNVIMFDFMYPSCTEGQDGFLLDHSRILS